MSVVDRICAVRNQSAIRFGSDLYSEISRELIDIGLNLAFFVFTTRADSSCARTLDGKIATCPVLVLYLKFKVDFQQTRIDPHFGNWDDKWEKTRLVRDTVNAILRRHGLESDYVSEHTFIFVQTLEELAFREIGRECKDAVQRFICSEAPGVVVSRVLWNGHQYHVIMRDKADCKRVKGKVADKVTKAIPEILAAADKDGFCQDHEAIVRFGDSGMNLFHLIREDV